MAAITKKFAPSGPLISEADRWRDDADRQRQQAHALFDPVTICPTA